MITVRRSTPEDARIMAETEALCLDFPWTAEQIVYEINRSDGVCFTAEIDGEYAGHLSAEAFDGECETSNIAVVEKFRRRGVGQKLFEALFDEMRARGVSEIYILVRCDNAPAVNLYRKVGFEAVGKRKGYYKGLDGITMRKNLL